jgi:hypothetical protein
VSFPGLQHFALLHLSELDITWIFFLYFIQLWGYKFNLPDFLSSDSGVWTRDLSPTPFYFSYFSARVSWFSQGWSQTTILLPLPLMYLGLQAWVTGPSTQRFNFFYPWVLCLKICPPKLPSQAEVVSFFGFAQSLYTNILFICSGTVWGLWVFSD